MEPSLYKKKITTVVKEYYKLLKNSNDQADSSEVYNTEEKFSEYPPGAPPEFDRIAFTESVTSYFDSYAKKMQDLISAADGTEKDLQDAEENVFKDIWTIGILLRPFYTNEFGERFTHQLRSMVLLEMQIISFMRLGYDTKTWTDRITNFPINDTSQLLATYNSFFNRDEVRRVLLGVTDSWFSAIKAKMAKDTAKFNEHIARANTNLKTMAAYLAQGIIQQQPDKFFESVQVV